VPKTFGTPGLQGGVEPLGVGVAGVDAPPARQHALLVGEPGGATQPGVGIEAGAERGLHHGAPRVPAGGGHCTRLAAAQAQRAERVVGRRRRPRLSQRSRPPQAAAQPLLVRARRAEVARPNRLHQRRRRLPETPFTPADTHLSLGQRSHLSIAVVLVQREQKIINCLPDTTFQRSPRVVAHFSKAVCPRLPQFSRRKWVRTGLSSIL